ncbi:MAG: hypothetical protein ACYSW8_31205 [Planctomycetota bacterium]
MRLDSVHSQGRRVISRPKLTFFHETPVKLTEADREPDGQDFVLPIDLPDGKRIQVVIPSWDHEHTWCHYAYAKDATYWLNFYHYS